MNNRYEAKREEMRNEFERERKAMRESFRANERKMKMDFWKFVILSIVLISLLGGYMIYRYGHIVTELYDSLIVYLNK